MSSKTRNHGCRWCQHAVGLFCLAQLQSKEGEHCICIKPTNLVSKFVEVVLHVEQGAKFGVEKVYNIYAAEMPVLEMGRGLENNLSN